LNVLIDVDLLLDRNHRATLDLDPIDDHRVVAIPQKAVELLVPPFLVVLERELVRIQEVIPHPGIRCVSISIVHG
jgi:hypothetical protein